MSTIYCIDTSTYIELKERYPSKNFKAIWKILQKMADEGRIKAPEAVLIELQEGDTEEECTKFVRDNKDKIIVGWSDDFNDAVNDVASRNTEIVEKDESSTKTNADLFVIALAKQNGYIVVTQESKRPSPKKMPYVCNKEGVDCINWLEFMDAENISL